MVLFLPLFGQLPVPCMGYYAKLFMLLVVSQMMLDAAYFESIISDAATGSDEKINICQCVILALHCLQATLQFFFGFDLHKSVIKRSYRRSRNWRTIFYGFLVVEMVLLGIYIPLVSFFSIFTYVMIGALLFKIYFLWPVHVFIEECREHCIPLAVPVRRSHSRHRYLYQELQAEEAEIMNRPGPSGMCMAKPVAVATQEQPKELKERAKPAAPLVLPRVGTMKDQLQQIREMQKAKAAQAQLKESQEAEKAVAAQEQPKEPKETAKAVAAAQEQPKETTMAVAASVHKKP